ncbi:MAG: hypothetical protein WBD00_01530 [Candidatus Omnitrophota bacterium]
MNKYAVRITRLITAAVVFLSLGYNTAQGEGFSKVMIKKIRSTDVSFARDIKVETGTYEQLEIDNISPAHVRKKTSSGMMDKLYISGTVEPLHNVTFAGVMVNAEFLDAEGNVVASEESGVVPRILGLRGVRRGRFTVSTDYNAAIKECKLTLIW